MSSLRNELEGLLDVDARLVGHEALVDHESDLNRAVGHDLLLHVLNTVDGVGLASLVLLPGLAVRALGRALGSLALSRAVREALVGHDAGVGQVAPRVREHATATSVVTRIAADKVLGAKRGRVLVLALDGEAVGEHLGSRERPARATLLLVADREDKPRESRASVEVRRNGRVERVVVLLRKSLVEMIALLRPMFSSLSCVREVKVKDSKDTAAGGSERLCVVLLLTM